MPGRGQGKNLRISRGGRPFGSSNHACNELHNEEELEDVADSTNGSPLHGGSPFTVDDVGADLSPWPSDDLVGGKRNPGSRFHSKVDLVLSVNEVSDPTRKEQVSGTNVDKTRRVRTKYMHKC